MISGVMPGISARALVLLVARSPIKAGSDDAGRPSGSAAAAMFLPRVSESFELKIAVSDSC